MYGKSFVAGVSRHSAGARMSKQELDCSTKSAHIDNVTTVKAEASAALSPLLDTSKVTRRAEASAALSPHLAPRSSPIDVRAYCRSVFAEVSRHSAGVRESRQESDG